MYPERTLLRWSGAVLFSLWVAQQLGRAGIFLLSFRPRPDSLNGPEIYGDDDVLITFSGTPLELFH
jgi:hypothetical protein